MRPFLAGFVVLFLTVPAGAQDLFQTPDLFGSPDLFQAPVGSNLPRVTRPPSSSPSVHIRRPGRTKVYGDRCRTLTRSCPLGRMEVVGDQCFCRRGTTILRGNSTQERGP